MKFFAVFSQVAERQDITPAAKLVHGFLTSRSIKAPTTQASISLISRALGLGRFQVRRALDDLLKTQLLILLNPGGPGKGATYRVPGLSIQGFKFAQAPPHQLNRVLKFRESLPHPDRRRLANILSGILPQDLRERL